MDLAFPGARPASPPQPRQLVLDPDSADVSVFFTRPTEGGQFLDEWGCIYGRARLRIHTTGEGGVNLNYRDIDVKVFSRVDHTLTEDQQRFQRCTSCNVSLLVGVGDHTYLHENGEHLIVNGKCMRCRTIYSQLPPGVEESQEDFLTRFDKIQSVAEQGAASMLRHNVQCIRCLCWLPGSLAVDGSFCPSCSYRSVGLYNNNDLDTPDEDCSHCVVCEQVFADTDLNEDYVCDGCVDYYNKTMERSNLRARPFSYALFKRRCPTCRHFFQFSNFILPHLDDDEPAQFCLSCAACVRENPRLARDIVGNPDTGIPASIQDIMRMNGPWNTIGVPGSPDLLAGDE